MLFEQLAQGGTAVGTGLNTKKGYVLLYGLSKYAFLFPIMLVPFECFVLALFLIFGARNILFSSFNKM